MPLIDALACLHADAAGPSPCPSRCAVVNNSNGACTAVYGGVGAVCGCNSGYAWDAGNGTCVGESVARLDSMAWSLSQCDTYSVVVGSRHSSK